MNHGTWVLGSRVGLVMVETSHAKCYPPEYYLENGYFPPARKWQKEKDP